MSMNGPVDGSERNLKERDYFLLWAGAAISLSEIWAGGLLASFGLAAGLLMGLESSGARAEQMARQLLLFDRLVDTPELVERIEAVSPEATRAFAEMLIGGAASVAVVGAGPASEAYAAQAAQAATLRPAA